MPKWELANVVGLVALLAYLLWSPLSHGLGAAVMFGFTDYPGLLGVTFLLGLWGIYATLRRTLGKPDSLFWILSRYLPYAVAALALLLGAL